VSTPAPRADRRFAPEWFLFAIVAVVLVRQLLLPPIVGLADNGDFVRVLEPLGLQHGAAEWGERYWGWLDKTYVPGPRLPLELESSQLLLTRAAQGLAGLVRRDGVLDIRVQGAVHLALYLLGLALVLRAARTFRAPARVTLGLAVLVAATDIAYVAPLNSFYAEAASLLFLVLVLGFGLVALREDGARGWALPGYLAAAALFVAAKPQNHPLAVPLAVVPLVLLPRLQRRATRLLAVLATLLLVVLAYDLHSRLPWSQTIRNRWNDVFFTILADSPDPRADLAEFGLEPELARFARVPAFADSIPIEAVTARYGFADVLRFHARHPSRFLRTAAVCAESAFVWRDPRMGNFTRDSGRPAGTLAHQFSAWSRLERAVLPASLPFLVVFLAGVMVAAALVGFRSGPASGAGSTALFGAALALAAGMEFGVCVVGDGYYDIVKHLYLFQVLFDACLFAAGAWIATWAAGRLARL
jgi:hypothetical protein